MSLMKYPTAFFAYFGTFTVNNYRLVVLECTKYPSSIESIFFFFYLTFFVMIFDILINVERIREKNLLDS